MVFQVKMARGVNEDFVYAFPNMNFRRRTVLAFDVCSVHSRGINQEPVALELENGFLVRNHFQVAQQSSHWDILLKESAKASAFDVFEKDPMSFTDIDIIDLMAIHQIRMLNARH